MKTLLSLILLTGLLLNCTKEEIETKANSSVLVKKDGEIQPRFAEKGCVVNTCPGTFCSCDPGHNCREESPCKTISGCGSIATPQQIEEYAILHANEMIDLGYVHPDNFEESKALAILILEQQNEDLENQSNTNP